MYKITIKPGSENFVGEEKILDWSEIGAFKENGEMLEEVISVNLKFRAGELGIVEIERYAPKVDKDFSPECIKSSSKKSYGPTTEKISFLVKDIMIKTSEPLISKPTKGNPNAVH